MHIADFLEWSRLKYLIATKELNLKKQEIAVKGIKELTLKVLLHW